MSDFYFFTDPELLDAQVAGQAFGPAGAAAGKDRFRVTDLHTSLSTDVPAFALCDGLICAQADVGGTLSLILKPTEQPAMDFPFISYVIYKGIDPNSLLTNGDAGPGGTIDTTQASVNKLVESVQKAWVANNNPGDATRECLGLHLTTASLATDYPHLDLSAYADDKPLEHLFYQGDEDIQLPLVRGGWRLGAFTGLNFGLDVIVESIAYRAKIALARKVENVIEVASLNPTATYAPDDTTYFMHWHAKEECLNFIDSCAFWGSFSAARLKVWDAADEKFERKSGGEIYETLLRGTHDDSSPTAGAFYNRNRARLDIRNEHNQSLNYYKNYGDTIQLTLDGDATIENQLESYYGTGWPHLTVARTDYPTGVGTKGELYFGLPRGDNAKPLLFLAAGSTKRRGQARRSRRFMEPLADASTGFTERVSVSIPVYDDGQAARTVASYLKLCYFKQATSGTETAPPAVDSITPMKQHAFDFTLRLPPESGVSSNLAGQGFCYFNDAVLVDKGAGRPGSHLAVPFCALDGVNAYFFLLPWFSYWNGSETTVPERIPKSLPVNSENLSALRDIAERYGVEVSRRIVDVDGTEANKVSVYFYAPGNKVSKFGDTSGAELIEQMPALILTAGELSQALALLPHPQFVNGTAFVNFDAIETTQHDSGGAPYLSPTLRLTYLADDGAGHVHRASNTLPIEVYGHDDL
jgi:hypothetical protein